MIDEKKLLAELQEWHRHESLLNQAHPIAEVIAECIECVKAQPRVDKNGKEQT